MMTRAVIAFLFAAAFAFALGRTVPDIHDAALAPGGGGPPQAIPIPAVTPPAASGGLVRMLTLRTPDARALASAEELRLTFGTYDTAPSLLDGVLAIGTNCVFRATSQRLGDNIAVAFWRQADCTTEGGSVPATLTLTFTGASVAEARTALWAAVAAPDTATLLTIEGAEPRLTPLGRAIAVRSPARISRASLLAFMWEIPAWGIWAVALSGAALVGIGALLVPRSETAGAAAGSFALAAGLAVCHAVAVPPLQAPDEPDHLLSYAKLRERPELTGATSAWARRIHFHRLAFGGEERFTPYDREQPFALDWPPAEIFAENVRQRSSTTTRLWQAMAPLVPAQPAHAVLFFRIVDSAIFGLSLAAGAALLAAAGVAPVAGLLALVLLLIPTLPFFGMQMSELPFTLAAFTLAGYASVMLAMQASPRFTGPMFGVAIALLAAGARSGWPALIVIAALGAGRMLVFSPGARRSDRAWFWGGVAVPGLVLFATGFLWVPTPFYEQWQLASFDPRAGVSSGSFVLALAAGATAGYLGESVARWAWLRAARSSSAPPSIALIARGLCALGIAFATGTLLWSIWAPLPMLAPIESPLIESATDYIGAVLLPLVTSARVRGFDFLTWTLLWGGFGWANVLLPSPAIAVVTITVSCAAIASLVIVAREKDGARAIFTVCGLAGLTASTAVVALSSYGLQRNVHGRYLLGGCVIGLCLLGAPAIVAASRRVSLNACVAVLLALTCGVHAFAVGFLLQKYFG